MTKPNTELNFDFPDIRDALYSGHTFEEIREIYLKNLQESDSIYNKFYANALLRAENLLSPNHLYEFEEIVSKYKEHMRQWGKQHNIQIIFKIRRKDYLGLNEKIQLFFHKGKPIEKVLDLLGIRLILCTDKKDTIEDIENCYKVLNETIFYLVNNLNCMLTEAEPRINDDFNKSDHPEIIVPDKDSIFKGFKDNVKDYIIKPKANGYQSLHFVATKPDSTQFEIQIRTYAMDIKAEYGTGIHSLYKQGRYGFSFDIDYSKINIPGFSLVDGGNEIYDIVGLRKSVDPFSVL